MNLKYLITSHFLTSLTFQVLAKLHMRMEEELIQTGASKTYQYELVLDETLDIEDEPHSRRIKRSDYDMEHYRSTCRHTMDIYPDKIIRVITPSKGQQQYPGGLDCEWEIIGSSECSPAIVCRTIDIRKSDEGDCSTDILIISDGIKRQKKFCGPDKGFSEPLEVSAGAYLYINFKTGDSTYFERLYKGFSCEVRCSQSQELPERRGILQEQISILEEYKRVCGKQFDEGSHRIVGGETAKKNEFPWQAALVYPKSRQPFCGGSLINDRFILTAAHCVLETPEDITSVKSASSFNILLRGYILDILYTGEENAETFIAGKDAVDTPSDKKEVILEVERIYVHPFYSKFVEHESDVALVKLKTKLSLTDEQTPTPICLPDMKYYSEEWAGKNATVSGWGKGTEDAGNTARALQKVVLPIITRDKCNEDLKKLLYLEITDEMLCAGYDEGKKDACQGDSGGPLVTQMGTHWVQVGIVSFGLGCARERSPGIYVNVVSKLKQIIPNF